MEAVPTYLSLAFALTTGLTVWIFYHATHRSLPTLYLLLGWLLLQLVLGLSGFYTITNTLPPRLLLALMPPLLGIALLLLTARGKVYLDTLRPDLLTLLHTVRIPVELVLLGLFLHNALPQLLTFEGCNWDIVSGISAPLVYYWTFKSKRRHAYLLLVWNWLCLGLLLNVVVRAMLSVPSPLQQLAFEQPNVAVLHFPFVWLPSCVVPLVLLAHVATIRQLLRASSNNTTAGG